MKTIRGIPASSGIAIGPVHWLGELKFQTGKRAADPATEQLRLDAAKDQVRGNLQRMMTSLQEHPEEAAIFEAHQMMLDDPDLSSLVRSHLEFGAEYAWNSAIEGYAARMEALQDEYLRARATDVRDVGQQVLAALSGAPPGKLSELPNPVILLARDLSPSQTGQLDRARLLGFATSEGSTTSHTAILARTLGLPAIVGVLEALREVGDADMVILDGSRGEIILDPEEATIREYEQRMDLEAGRQRSLLVDASLPAVTRDGTHIEVVANIGSIEDAQNALVYGAEGVGLLRTEFLYMERTTLPTEEEQYRAYRAILEIMGDRPVVIRTLDIGGDKSPAYMDLGQEENPFLGWRAIRVCLDRPGFFKDQLRAVTRAAVGHDVRIMFPMIATLEELRRTRAILAEARVETGIADRIQVGMMVEVPSVVQMADLFAHEVDFFSIGTNDLTQYTFAVDRTNPKVASIADACHPAVLRQIRHVIQVAHAQGKWVGVCGELAGDPAAIPILLGLGLDEFSMVAASIPAAKQVMKRWSLEGARDAAIKALQLESSEQVRELVLNHESQ